MDDGNYENEEYLANLNIIKSEQDAGVRYNIKRAETDIDRPQKAFFTGLPQTQSQLEELSIESADYQIKEYVEDLFEKQNCTKKQAMQKILKFFSAYDGSRDLNIIVQKKRLDQMRKENQKLRTY